MKTEWAIAKKTHKIRNRHFQKNESKSRYSTKIWIEDEKKLTMDVWTIFPRSSIAVSDPRKLPLGRCSKTVFALASLLHRTRNVPHHIKEWYLTYITPRKTSKEFISHGSFNERKDISQHHLPQEWNFITMVIDGTHTPCCIYRDRKEINSEYLSPKTKKSSLNTQEICIKYSSNHFTKWEDSLGFRWFLAQRIAITTRRCWTTVESRSTLF